MKYKPQGGEKDATKLEYISSAGASGFWQLIPCMGEYARNLVERMRQSGFISRTFDIVPALKQTIA